MVQRGTGAEHPASYEIVELVVPELIVLRCGPMPEIGVPEGTLDPRRASRPRRAGRG